MVCGKDPGAHDRMFEAMTIFSLIAEASQPIRMGRTGLPCVGVPARRAREGKIGVSFAALQE